MSEIAKNRFHRIFYDFEINQPTLLKIKPVRKAAIRREHDRKT
jgi:hypothetical protein